VSVARAVETRGHPDIGQDAGTLAGIAQTGIRISADLGEAEDFDVAVDFSAHSAVPANILKTRDLARGYVLGTTGLSPEECDTVREAAESIPVLWAPNTSVGMNILFDLTRRVASVLGPDYDAEIVEMHHRHKKDAPSGTAIRLAEALAHGRGRELDEVAVYGRSGETGERPRGEIGIHTLRGGDVVGDHRVIFAADGEILELSHRATSRDAFATGALRAAVWLNGRAPGLYDMGHVLRANED
jgi:4-hydroxy-tetrahydrodipicolinate reductase